MAFLNNAGVERLWAHILLKLNHKVDKIEGKGLSTEDFTTEEKEKLASIQAGAGESVQSDWEQADETAKDFIKNKPFYAEEPAEIEKIVLEETTYDCNEESFFATLPSNLTFQVGKTYTVMFNGERYECVAWAIESEYDGTIIGIGDSIVAYGNPEYNNGEPFACFYSLAYPEMGAIFVPASDGTHTISISYSEIRENIHPLDLKYLSGNDTAPYQQLVTDENGNAKWEERLAYSTRIKGVFFPETKLYIEDYYMPDTYFQIDPYTIKDFIVTFDGTEYQCSLEEFGYGYCLGNNLLPDDHSAEGEPFAILINGYGMLDSIHVKTPGEYLVSIESVLISYHPLSEKYLPNLIGKSGEGEGSEVFNFDTRYNVNTAIGDYSHAEGRNTVAYGSYSHSEGSSGLAYGSSSHVEGSNNIAAGLYSHAEGYRTVAYGQYSHAEGYGNDYPYSVEITGEANATTYTFTSNYRSWVEPNVVVRCGDNVAKIISAQTDSSPYTFTVDKTLSNTAVTSKTAILYTGILAIGENSHSEGRYSQAIGKASHAEGDNTQAIGDYSHSEGNDTRAAGQYSHVEGRATKASGEAQHVQGKYNIEDTESVYAHIVGNGTAWNSLSNAHTIDWDGNAWFAGNIKVGGISQDDEAAQEVALKSDIPEGVPANYTANQHLVTDNKGSVKWENILYVTPEMYGAVGADTMSTETTSVDAQAFKKMINSGAKRFIFEAGRTYHFYGVLRTWSFPEGAIIEGNGATLKVMDGAYGGTKTCLFTFGSNSEISNLNLDGATMIVNGSHIRVSNCHAINSRGNGFTVHMSAAKENNDIVFDKCTSDGSNEHGFAISNDQTFESTVNINGSHTNDIRYISCVARSSNNTIASYNWSAGFCVDYKGVWAEDVSEDYKAYISNILYTDCISEGNAESGYHCESHIIEPTNVIYRGCISRNNGTKESPEYGAGFLYRKGIIIDQCKTDGCLTPVRADEIESVNDIMNISLLADGFNYANFVTDKYSSNINRGVYYYGDITSNTIEQLQMRRINDTTLYTTGIDGAFVDASTGFISVADNLEYEHAKILTPIIPLIHGGIIRYGLDVMSQIATTSPKNIQVSLVAMDYNLSNISMIRSTSLTPPVNTVGKSEFADEIAVSELPSGAAYIGIFLDLLDGTTGTNNSNPIVKNMYLHCDATTDEHINELISTALAAFTNGEEVSY